MPFFPFSFSYPTVFAPVIRWELVKMKRSKDSKIFRCLFLLFGMFFGLFVVRDGLFFSDLCCVECDFARKDSR